MKKLKHLSIRKKLPLFIGIFSFIILEGINLFIYLLLSSAFSGDSKEIARLRAAEMGNRLAEYINGAANVTRSISEIVAQAHNSKLVPAENRRELVYNELMLVALSEEGARLPSIWCIFEPNVLDGQDSLYRNKSGSNSNGNFAPWLGHSKGRFEAAAMESAYTIPAYTLAKTKKREILTEPILYDIGGGKKQRFFSIAMPLMDGNRFLGAIGTDFDAEELVRTFRRSTDNDMGRLVTNEGYIAFDFETAHIGAIVGDGDRALLEKLAKGEMFDDRMVYEGEKVYTIYVPVQLGLSEAPWFYMVNVYESEMHATANTIIFIIVTLMLLAIILIVLASSKLMRHLTKRIEKIAGTIDTLSTGDLQIEIETNDYQDELGRVNRNIKTVVDGLQNISAFAKSIGDGDFSAEFEPISEKDTLGNSLLEMREKLHIANEERRERQIEEEQRNWSTTGVAKFAEILRQDNDNMETLAYSVISNLVKYMDANQGGVFLLNDETNEPFLEMKACYAYNRKKFAEKKIQIGEGLAGTCYLEGEAIYMTEVPEDYITITSGLGDDNPRAILIMPLKINGIIYGVIELASFKPFEHYKLEFMEKLSESIAATISSVKVNIRTNKLLEQTKLQAEEMANAEEELRQNMEEMQATQEESRRRELELSQTLEQMQKIQKENEAKGNNMQKLYDSLFDTFNVGVFSSDGIIIDMNDSAIAAMNTTKEQLVGKPLNSFLKDTKELFDRMKENKVYKTVHTVSAGGNELKVMALFIPFNSAEGDLEHIIMISYKI